MKPELTELKYHPSILLPTSASSFFASFCWNNGSFMSWHVNICKVFLKAEMHKKGAKYSCFHLELIFSQDVLAMAYTLCENWRGWSDLKNFRLMDRRVFALILWLRSIFLMQAKICILEAALLRAGIGVYLRLLHQNAEWDMLDAFNSSLWASLDVRGAVVLGRVFSFLSLHVCS